MKNKTLKHQPTRNTKAARVLRREMTPAEKLLWKHVRNRQLGYKIRRQYAITGTIYVGDFCCPEARLIIEIDGGIHDNQVAEDADRQGVIEARGFQVIRFRNAEIFDKLECVLAIIRESIEENLSTAKLLSKKD